VQFSLGHKAIEAADPPVPDGWRRVDSPQPWVSNLMALAAGVALIMGLFVILIVASVVTTNVEMSDTQASTPWASVVLALAIYIPLHESLHAAGHPGFGLSPQTIMVFWPARLRFGVYYAGCMSRRLWLWMRILPLIGLTLFPTTLLVLSHWVRMPDPLKVFFQVLMLVNGLGAGGDVVAMFLVRRQVPAGTQMCFWGGRAYWRGGASTGSS
jgi:hypothetical protein